jgi:Flp pilus assembly protein TadG
MSRARLARLAGDRRGIAAVEFALVAPVFCLLFAAAVDFGGVLFTRFKLNAAVAAGANYAQVNSANVSAAGGAALATNIANIVQTNDGGAWADDNVVVNNGPATTVVAGAPTTSGVAANADACYCPTGTSGALVWGSARTCGQACPGTDAGLAGKFVVITASKPYTPLFADYGIVRDGLITASATVQVQ